VDKAGDLEIADDARARLERAFGDGAPANGILVEIERTGGLKIITPHRAAAAGIEALVLRKRFQGRAHDRAKPRSEGEGETIFIAEIHARASVEFRNGETVRARIGRDGEGGFDAARG